MSLWVILPVSLPSLTITGIWVVYVMALYNQHVCPVDNWLYNQSCDKELYLQSGPTLCCTLDNVPLISKCGTLPPESCFFSLICSAGSFMVMVIVFLRYAHVIEKYQNCVLNTAGLSTGWICAAGLIMIGNFQVDNAKILHYVGAGVAFPTSMLFVCLQSALTYRLAKTQGEYSVAHLRLGMTLLAFITLVLSILYRNTDLIESFIFTTKAGGGGVLVHHAASCYRNRRGCFEAISRGSYDLTQPERTEGRLKGGGGGGGGGVGMWERSEGWGVEELESGGVEELESGGVEELESGGIEGGGRGVRV
uniref:Zgc:154058 n=1 Tax=Oncorhynchus mykiss TaxID=8022 RepID=A0A8K9X6A0_ONCMY